MESKAEGDQFLRNQKTDFSSNSNSCFSKWWNQEYYSQKKICGIIHTLIFRGLVIFLVIADTSLVIVEILLDSFKIRDECEKSTHHTESSKNHIELAMEIAHYSSIGILIFFAMELLVKIYSFGKEFWNIHRRKMEYLDAFVVITSLIIDLYFLNVEEKILGEQLLLFFAFRLWRFVRIISSVAESIRHGERKHKTRLNKQYLVAIRRLIDLLIHKTNYIEQQPNNDDLNLNSIREYYQLIDEQCQSALEQLNENHELTSSAIVAKFIGQLEKLENKNNDTYEHITEK